MIPQELKGTGAVPFLEWFNDITDRHLLQYCNMPTLIKIAYFYSQPFSIEMLLELFEEWEFNGCYEIDYDNRSGYKLLYCDEYVMSFNTLNDFITLCNLSGVNLKFKE